jgi:hypothetical protein
MTRTFGAALGFLFIVMFFAGVAVQNARAASPRAAYAFGR